MGPIDLQMIVKTKQNTDKLNISFRPSVFNQKRNMVFCVVRGSSHTGSYEDNLTLKCKQGSSDDE